MLSTRVAWFVFFFPLLALTTAYAAQREYTVGTTVNVSGGGSNEPQNATPQAQSTEINTFYGVYPSITLTSPGARSALSANYAFGLDRTHSSDVRQNQSHSASLRVSGALGPLWTVGVTNTFTRTEDLRTFNAMRGVTPAEDPTLVFFPIASRTSSTDNTFSANAVRELDSEARMSFQASHSIRHYGAGSSPAIAGILSNQQQFSGGLTYAQKVAARDEISFGYTGSYLDCTNFHDAVAHAANVRYSMQFAREVTLQLGAGMSSVSSIGAVDRYTGYDATANLQKTIQSSAFSLRYVQNSAQPSGLGSTSRSRTAGLGLNHSLGKVATAFVDISAFDSKGTLDNSQDARGVAAAANLGFAVTAKVSIQVGAQFQRQRGSTALDSVQKRLFVSVRFAEPQLWRFR